MKIISKFEVMNRLKSFYKKFIYALNIKYILYKYFLQIYKYKTVIGVLHIKV